MKVYFERIDEFSSERTEFYTVRLGNGQITEFELFDQKDFPDHQTELEILYNVIYEMRGRGAKHFYFKSEGPANALPIVPKEIISCNNIDFGLRLYCIRLTDNLLVLLNGDIKTQHKPLNCPNVKKHFENAVKIARALDMLLNDGEISFVRDHSLTNIEIEI